MTPDFELDLLRLAVALDACRCITKHPMSQPSITLDKPSRGKGGGWRGILTGGIFASADLDELLDVRDFLRHGGRGCRRRLEGVGVGRCRWVFWHGFAVWKLGEAETLSADGSSHVAVLWR